MAEAATITFYKVTKCGYYAGDREHDYKFGSLAGLMPQLAAWGRPLTLGQRKTFEPSEGEHDQHGTYLLDIVGRGDLWVVTLWNESPAVDGSVASVRDNSQLGQAEVVVTPLEEGTIPGYATYFMVIPSLSYVAGVRFDRLVYGHQAMRDYVQGFLDSRSPHVVTTRHEHNGEIEIEITGYRERPADEAEPLKPKFRTQLHVLPGPTDELIQNVHRIKRVARKTKLSLRTVDNTTLLQGLLQQVGLRDRAAPVQPVKIKYHVDTVLNEDELRTIINAWEAGHQRGGYEDVGFSYEGDMAKVHWLSHSVPRSELDLDVQRDNKEVVNAASLLDALERHRDQILRDVGA
jgi:hypothetical protein